MESQSSRTSGMRNVREWEARKQERTAELLAEIEAARAEIRNYAEWQPAPDDWMRLAIGMAIKHSEPGFEFTPPIHDATAEANWHRDNLVYAFTTEGNTAARAAVLAAKAIEQTHARSDGERFGKAVSAEALEGGYSSRQKARKDGREVAKRHRSRMPHHVESYRQLDAHFSEILNDARSLSRD